MMPAWLGDCVMASALIKPLAERSGGALQLWCRPAHRELFEQDPAVEEVLAYDPKGEHRGLPGLVAWRRRCREAKMNPEYVWILPDSLSAALGARAAGVKHRVGRVGQGRDLLLTNRCPQPPRRQRHWIDEQAALLPPSAAADGEPLMPRIQPTPEAVEAIGSRLGAASLQGKEICVLVPGATYGPAKRWSGYAEFARLLPTGITPVIVGSNEECPLTGEIATRIREGGRSCLDLAGTLGLAELAALMAAARFVLSNDTGPMHLAAAVGARVLGLFLSTDPVWTAPRGAQVRYLSSTAECRPCFDRRCAMPEMICATDIEPWALRGALAEWLEPEAGS